MQQRTGARSVDKGGPRRKRRSAEEISRRILGAAGEAFKEHGFAGATTATIAGMADVTEAQLFRTFGSKVELFREAIFEPLNQHFSDFHARHRVDDGAARPVSAADYVTELQAFLAEHSKMLMALLVAQTYAPEGSLGGAETGSLETYFERCATMMAGRIGDSPRVEPRLMVRVAFAAVLACVMFRDWIFPEGIASEREIGDAMIDFIIDGLSANPDPGLRPAGR